MTHYKGTIVGIRQCGGCVEVIVAGEMPGSFPIDNSCFRMIVGCEGLNWIGRCVEYRDASMRFLDAPETPEAAASPNHVSLPPRP
jgi:hypothetical protein